MFLTPDAQPFWGGTYFPKTPRYGRPGFRQILADRRTVGRPDVGPPRTRPSGVEDSRGPPPCSPMEHVHIEPGDIRLLTGSTLTLMKSPLKTPRFPRPQNSHGP